MIERPEYVQDAITADEIGLSVGHYGPFLMKSSYQPIYHVDNDFLVPNAVEGLIKVQYEGRCVPPCDFFSGLDEHDHMFIECMCRALHLYNYHHVGVENIDLYFNFNPTTNSDYESSLKEVQYMIHRLTPLRVRPEDLVCEVTENGTLDNRTLRYLTKEFRRHGIRIAIDDFGASYSNIERVEMLAPDIVKIDGDWFRQMASAPAATRLMKSMIANFRKEGIDVLVEGIETPAQLETALETGANLFQGYLLSPPLLAGSHHGLPSLDLDVLCSRADNVIRLAL